MSDLVERLQKATQEQAWHLVDEAAARIRELEAALKPITMPDVRLRVGEHKLTAHEVLSVCNDILRDRAARQALGGDNGNT